ncbi:MAG: hypothetical protein ACFFDK_05610 [Promethearchaeota archaeon]
MTIEYYDTSGNKVNFQNELEEIFKFLREYKQELLDDLKGNYLLSLKNKENNNEKIL